MTVKFDEISPIAQGIVHGYRAATALATPQEIVNFANNLLAIVPLEDAAPALAFLMCNDKRFFAAFGWSRQTDAFIAVAKAALNLKDEQHVLLIKQKIAEFKEDFPDNFNAGQQTAISSYLLPN